MPIEEQEINYVHTGHRGNKDGTTQVGNPVADILIPEFGEFTDYENSPYDAMANYDNEYGSPVYVSTNSSFTFIQRTRLINASLPGEPAGSYNQFASIPIEMVPNTLPTVSGIKIIGVAGVNDTGEVNLPCPPNHNVNHPQLKNRTFMFKICREFNWIFGESSAPYYPKLNKCSGDVEFYADTGALNGYYPGTGITSPHGKNLHVVNELNQVGPRPDSEFGTNSFTDAGWTTEEVAAGFRVLQYPLFAFFDSVNIDYELTYNNSFSFIRGFVTTY